MFESHQAGLVFAIFLFLASCRDMGAQNASGVASEQSAGQSQSHELAGGQGGSVSPTGSARELASSGSVATMDKACGKAKGTPFHDNQNFQGAGCATAFGLTTSGQEDKQDNGRGAWGDNTRNTSIVGVSLPIPVIQAYERVHGKAHHVCVEVFNPSNGKTIMAPIVDKGPHTKTGNAIDLTYRANKMLGGDGKDFMTYKIIPGKKCSTRG